MKLAFKEKTTIVQIIIIVTIISAVILYFILQRVEMNRQKKIVNDLVILIEDCKKIGESPNIYIRGNYLIWQLSKIYQRNDYKPDYCIDDRLGLTSSNGQLTVFLALPPRGRVFQNNDSSVGLYNTSNQPAYKTYVDVCVLHWPEKKAIGMYSFTCMPPTKRIKKPEPEFGDTNKCVLNWVKSLPKTLS